MENDRIGFVGKAKDRPANFNPDEEIDGTGMLVLPGFIDTHVHNMQQLGRGLVKRLTRATPLL